jgi:glycine betaine/proline transport system permease protein
MASLSMVIIASIIGGTSDIGWEVLTTIRKAQFGESLLVGMVIALMAMIIDRITFGLAQRSGNYDPKEKSLVERYWLLLIAALGGVVLFVMAQIFSFLVDWPREMVWSPGRVMNDALAYLIINYHAQIDAMKTFAFFYVMLPIKIGLQEAVSPFTWGFALTPTHKAIYALVMAGFSLWFGLRGKNMAGILVMCLRYLFILD